MVVCIEERWRKKVFLSDKFFWGTRFYLMMFSYFKKNFYTIWADLTVIKMNMNLPPTELKLLFDGGKQGRLLTLRQGRRH